MPLPLLPLPKNKNQAQSKNHPNNQNHPGMCTEHPGQFTARRRSWALGCMAHLWDEQCCVVQAQAPAPDASGALKRDREDQNGEECPVVDEVFPCFTAAVVDCASQPRGTPRAVHIPLREVEHQRRDVPHGLAICCVSVRMA